MLKKVEIDLPPEWCETCRRRSRETLQLLADVRCATLGEAWCPECGTTFDVWTDEENLRYPP